MPQTVDELLALVGPQGDPTPPTDGGLHCRRCGRRDGDRWQPSREARAEWVCYACAKAWEDDPGITWAVEIINGGATASVEGLRAEGTEVVRAVVRRLEEGGFAVHILGQQLALADAYSVPVTRIDLAVLLARRALAAECHGQRVPLARLGDDAVADALPLLGWTEATAEEAKAGNYAPEAWRVWTYPSGTPDLPYTLVLPHPGGRYRDATEYTQKARQFLAGLVLHGEAADGR